MSYFYNNVKVILSLFFCLFMLNTLQAQDPDFSQFYSAPAQMNPAMNGVFSGEYRFVANYRTQNYAVLGNQSYKTVGASFEGRRGVGRDDYFSYGITALNAKVGESSLSQSRALLNLSYLKQVGGGGYRSSDQYLVGGFQLGVGQWKLNTDNLWFSSQFDLSNNQASVNTALASGEAMGELNTDMFIDLNAGLLYYNVIDDNNSFYIGGAFHHLNEPLVSFVDDGTEKLHRRWLGQMGGELSLTREISLLPAIVAMGQGGALQGIGGMNLRFTNHDWREVAIRAGLWGRVTNQGDSGMGLEAMIVSAILEVERWQFGLSYDITMSDLSAANNSRGAFELSLIYVHPAKQRFKVNCPRL